MTQRKPPQPPKKAGASIVRSSAAEYLTFIAASGQGGVEAVYAEENVWITQKMMGVLYDVNVRTVNEHLKKIFGDSELQEDSVIRKFRISIGWQRGCGITLQNADAVCNILSSPQLPAVVLPNLDRWFFGWEPSATNHKGLNLLRALFLA